MIGASGGYTVEEQKASLRTTNYYGHQGGSFEHACRGASVNPWPGNLFHGRVCNGWNDRLEAFQWYTRKYLVVASLQKIKTITRNAIALDER